VAVTLSTGEPGPDLGAPAEAAGRAEIRLRRHIKLAATLALVGIALAVADAPVLGGGLTVLSVLGLAFTLHRFGRLGPDSRLAA
jgi:hypothetical protein